MLAAQGAAQFDKSINLHITRCQNKRINGEISSAALRKIDVYDVCHPLIAFQTVRCVSCVLGSPLQESSDQVVNVGL